MSTQAKVYWKRLPNGFNPEKEKILYKQLW
jgi:hypothetical protein